MVERAGDYRWSSYTAHAQGRADAAIRDHREYLALGTTSITVINGYRKKSASYKPCW
jgi:hypothetical protein